MMGMAGKLDLYATFIKLEFMKMLTYRVSYVTGIVNYLVQIGAYFFLWQAIYIDKPFIGGFNLDEMLSYLIIAWVARSFYFNNLDRQITNEIREGSVAIEFLRPYNYFVVKLARSFGEALFRLLFFALPSGIVLHLLYPFRLPSSPSLLLLFTVAIIGSFLLNSLINYIVGLMAFFTLNTSGIRRAKRVIVDLFSGLLLPINLYPYWAQTLIKFMPFPAMTYLPNQIYLGKLETHSIIKVFVIQACWIVLLGIVARVMWAWAKRHVVIQGG